MKFSLNLNKIALLRNARGENNPSLEGVAELFNDEKSNDNKGPEPYDPSLSAVNNYKRMTNKNGGYKKSKLKNNRKTKKLRKGRKLKKV